jgi:glycosyltransferase involved in cell wall biosynthesis
LHGLANPEKDPEKPNQMLSDLTRVENPRKLYVENSSIGFFLIHLITRSPSYRTKQRREKEMLRSAVSVVIPAYNEEGTVGHVIEETISVMDNLRVPYEIIIVDDGSTDNTRRIATAYKATVLTNEKNRGKGYAVRRGFQQAQGEIVVTIDADGAHSPKEIPDLVIPLFNGTDVAAGSRFLNTRANPTTMLNRIGNFLFNATIQTLTGRRVTDSQTGFRAIKKQVVDRLNLASDGFDIESEITVKSLKNGFKFEEKPITIRQREYSKSKLRILADGAKILKTILRANVSRIEN